MSNDDRHDYRNLMKENGGDDLLPAPNGDFGDILKLFLGVLIVVQVIVWIIT